jgi:hypothetical protein
LQFATRCDLFAAEKRWPASAAEHPFCAET